VSKRVCMYLEDTMYFLTIEFLCYK